MFREITSIPTIAMQLSFAAFGAVILFYMLPKVVERVWISGAYSNDKQDGVQFSKHDDRDASCRNETQCNLEFISQLLVMAMMVYLVYENFLNAVTPTLIRFTLAGHSFRNSRTNSVNTNQFLNAHYPRYLIKLYLFPFSIFLCSVAWTMKIWNEDSMNNTTDPMMVTRNNGVLYRMTCFIISLTIAFLGVNEFRQTFFSLQYELDLVSQYIYVRVQKKHPLVSTEQVVGIIENSSGDERVVNWSFLLSFLIPLLISVYFIFFSSEHSQIYLGNISLLFGCVTLILENFRWPFPFLEHNLKLVLTNLGYVAFVWGLENMFQ